MDLFVSRKRWGAARPKGAAPAFSRSEVRGVVVHHAAGATPASHSGCAAAVRGIQRQHMADRSEGWVDIAYNFLICPHGATFRGRGFDLRSGANGTTAANRRYVAVCVLGTNPAPTAAIRAAISRLRFDVLRRYPGAREIRPHSAFQATACPGSQLVEWVRGSAR